MKQIDCLADFKKVGLSSFLWAIVFGVLTSECSGKYGIEWEINVDLKA